jgi:signal transduction histidine kinase
MSCEELSSSAHDGILCPLPMMPHKAEPISSELCSDLAAAGCPLAPSVQERLGFEKLLAELSATFVNVPADQVDSQIVSALRSIVEHLNADRGGLGEVLAEQNLFVITHSYAAPGVPVQPRTIATEALPWYAATVLNGEVFQAARLPDDLPPEATAERAYCAHVGLKSHVMIPLKVMGAVVGAIGFAAFRTNRAWPDELIQRLRLVGEIFTNALARKQAEQALSKAEMQARKLREELAHATRLQLVSHLTMSIAHEVNQPLCAIASNAQTAIELLDMGDLEEVEHALQDIWADAKRGSDVIGRVRNMVKKEGPCQEKSLIGSIIEELTPLLRREAAAKGVRLQVESTGDRLTVVCDRVQVQQVVLNLALNALEAVSLESVGPPEVRIRVARDQPNWAHVRVEDSGVGLSTEDCERVFAPFFTTKAKGLGMGLAISRSIIASHGGSIWTTRGAEHGTTFHFRLPVVDGGPS